MTSGRDSGNETDAKRALRREMRALRKALPDQPQRSASVVGARRAAAGRRATERVVMAFTSVPGEPDTVPFIAWCRERGKTVHVPEDDPAPDPATIDVVIVPGTAFTPDGHRLGQGGGWYDRFLPRLRPDCLTVGVGFAPQLVEQLPVEPHDVTARPGGHRRRLHIVCE